MVDDPGGLVNALGNTGGFAGPCFFVGSSSETENRRRVVYEGMGDDKPAADVKRPIPGGGTQLSRTS